MCVFVRTFFLGGCFLICVSMCTYIYICVCVCLYISRERLAWGSHNRKIASRSGGRTAGVDELIRLIDPKEV